MQIKIFSIPLFGGEALEDDMNRFLRAHKIIKVQTKLANKHAEAVWTFEIRYVEGAAAAGTTSAVKKDYRELLDDNAFAVYSSLREIRKKIAEKEGVPPYAVFTNDELAAMAQLEKRALNTIRAINGIGIKKTEKYAAYFTDEANQPPA